MRYSKPHFPIQLINEKRNFQWKDFEREMSKRLTFTAWMDYGYEDQQSMCVSISTRGDTFSNWVYSSCFTWYSICLDSIEKEVETEQQPTRIPESSDVNVTSPDVFDRLFRCTQTGEYILSYFVCNHHPDCLDQSDESQACQTSTSETNVVNFRCDNGKYISLNLVCDFYQDCYDGSEERNCFKSTCLSGQWTCHNGQCIAGYDVCDSEKECADGSDEWSTTCNGHSKQIQTVWPCPSKRHVPLYRMCDRIPDCYDGSDEKEKDCYLGNPTYSCSTHCHERMCNDTLVRVHLASNGYEAVHCSYRDDVALMTWPFSALIGTMAEQENCYFSTRDTGYTTIMLINEQPVSVQYKSEHILEALIKHSRDCYQLVELCYLPFYYQQVYIQFSSEWDGRHMQNLTYCGNVGSICEPLGCYQDPPVHHPVCQGTRTFMNSSNVPIRWIKLQGDDESRPVLRITPPVCTEDKTLIDPKYLEPQRLCQNGMSYYPHHRCLMDFDVTGEPSTCRDLTHLQNCEKISCPENFMKCPDSYCLHVRFLCDGVPHCPNNEDEQLCICQVVIYRKSRTHMTLRRMTNKQDRDIAVARALTAVVATDFFCWFPIGVLGIWTSLGGSVSGDVYAWVMVFVLPINSALNPFLYTFANTWKKRKLQMQQNSSYKGAKSETEMTNVVLEMLKTFRHKKGSKPLTEFLCNSGELRVRDAFNIIQSLSESLVYLHSHNLVHGNISAESVQISSKNDRVTDAIFSMDHHQVSRDFEQFNDMYDFGMIVKILLRKIRLP
ncbi:low-density lipoprotein receptor-related protein 2-like isoform X2 [Mizuhopecten yessoensis]|uniref:low-density lipoprotein receptor-related protein 2-like isoform X2 n=1 Tax=Mizuhopecten yessoensis TaxID=6573 RepID=UPI000B458C1A|nr:low-density lipoprotein receptor-related protein 2-like isoform X2 [Mizuhopecten yessoensis]